MTAALNVLQPARWHSYGMWPELSYPGHIPMIYSEILFDRVKVADWLRTRPGLSWMLPNEPERPEQASMTWQQGVSMTLEVESMARSASNEYQLCSPAVSINMVDYDGLTWLTNMMTHLRQKENHWRFAYWCVHGYRSPTLAHFKTSWARWKAWYATWGSGAPVILSEVCAEGSPLADQMAVMTECKAMLTRGEVAGVFWFSAYQATAGSQWPNAALTTLNGSTATLTPLGQYWMSLK